MTYYYEITMYNLFTKKYASNNSVVRPAAFEMIRRTYQREVDKIISYYNNRVFAIKSQHLLCRLINQASASTDLDIIRYVETVSTRSPYVGRYYNFSSEISFGAFHQGVFYGEKCKELIIQDDAYFNPFETLANWSTLEPVKVLDHPVSDLTLMLPDGERNSTAEGLAVISINIPMLLVMYLGFMRSQQQAIAQGKDSILGVTHFVKMYVLPGMLRSHLEICLFNRFVNLTTGAPMSEALKHLPFPIVDYADKVDRVLEDVLDHTKNKKLLYTSVLKNIPSFYSEDMQDFLQMPDLTHSLQLWWVLYLTRLKAINAVIVNGGDKAKSMNGHLLRRMEIDIQYLNSSKVYESRLPPELLEEVKDLLLSLTAT